jgi:hypothetical protein
MTMMYVHNNNSALTVMAPTEEKGGRHKKSMMNYNHGVDKKWEKRSLAHLVRAPVSALQGIADWADEESVFRHKTIKSLGTWKYFIWAEAIVTLCDLKEKHDHSHGHGHKSHHGHHHGKRASSTDECALF